LGKILGRYILREVFAASLTVTAGLLAILLADELAAVLQRAAANQYPQDVVLELIVLQAVQTLPTLLPLGLLLGIVLAFGRLYHDSEMAAALACGATPRILYLPVALLTVAAAGFIGLLTLKLAPDATVRVLNLRTQALRAGQFAPIMPGKFRLFGGSNAVVYAEDVDKDGTLLNVFVERNRGSVVEVAVADSATHKTTHHGMTHIITLYNGERDEGVPGSAEFKMMQHFDELTVPMEVPPLGDISRNLDAESSLALLHATDRTKRAELQGRIGLPVMALVLAVVGIPLSRLRPRQGRYDRVWIAALIYFLYIQLFTSGRTWMAHGTVPQELGLWWVHGLVLIVAFAIVWGPGFVRRLRAGKAP